MRLWRGRGTAAASAAAANGGTGAAQDATEAAPLVPAEQEQFKGGRQAHYTGVSRCRGSERVRRERTQRLLAAPCRSSPAPPAPAHIPPS